VRTKTPFLDEKMLDAAGKLFGSRRFHEVRMEDIAVEAGVSKGTLYRYFRDKDEMFLALLEQASAKLLAELKRRVAQAQTGRARLIGVVDAVVTLFDAHPHMFDLILRAELGQDQGKRFPWQEVRAEGMRLVFDIFEDGRTSGEFRVHHPETAMLMFLGGMRAVIRAGKRPRPERLAEQIVDDFLHGAASIVKRASKTA
jgi:TetR/AcrR family fatty acid metabolism transcriptional regulator